MSKQVDNNPKTRMGNAKLPFHLLPVPAMIEQSLAHADGGFKYMPNNWHDEPISVSVYAGAILRHLIHFLMGENRADDSQVHHLGHIMACCAMVIDSQVRGTLNDNRAGMDMDAYHTLLEDAEKRLGFLAARDVSKFDLHDVVRPNEKAVPPKNPREGSGRRVALQKHICFARNPRAGAEIDPDWPSRYQSGKTCALEGGDLGGGDLGFGTCTKCNARIEDIDT